MTGFDSQTNRTTERSRHRLKWPHARRSIIDIGVQIPY